MTIPIKLVEVWSFYTSKDKIITGQEKMHPHHSYTTIIALAVLVAVTEDFTLTDKISRVLHDTESYQIRPKTLYKSSRGIFYKEGSERRYLSTQEIINLKIENKELGKYL